MFNMRALALSVLLLIVSGCLQEPAPITGQKNYYLESDVNNRTYQKTDEGENFFEDENKEPQTELKSFDPYEDQNLIENNAELDFQPESRNKTRDWNSIFSDSGHKAGDKEHIGKSKALRETESPKPVEKTENKATPPAIKPNVKIIKEEPKKIPITLMTKDVKKKEELLQENKLNTTKDDTNYVSKPGKAVIQSSYGKAKDSELSDGTVFKMEETNIKSMGDGKVIYVDEDQSSSKKTIIVKHLNGLIVSYSYNGDTKTKIHKDIKTGEVIGSVNSDKNLLYCTVRRNGKTIDLESIIR